MDDNRNDRRPDMGLEAFILGGLLKSILNEVEQDEKQKAREFERKRLLTYKFEVNLFGVIQYKTVKAHTIDEARTKIHNKVFNALKIKDAKFNEDDKII